jgi:hypothetical protein
VLGEFQELARQYTTEAIEVLAQIMRDEKAPTAARVAAADKILDRAWGRPPQFITGDEQRFRRANEMSDDELAAIASGQVKLIGPPGARVAAANALLDRGYSKPTQAVSHNFTRVDPQR